ncbi:hypothetical protein [Halarchaeum sp. P4]|uniref:hypothetical protein n=1 Tax=Halarchaeum sp. P4 TaxID=3421639 RepID=UPI003EC0C04E
MVNPENGKSLSGRPQIEETLKEGVPEVQTEDLNSILFAEHYPGQSGSEKINAATGDLK